MQSGDEFIASCKTQWNSKIDHINVNLTDIGLKIKLLEERNAVATKDFLEDIERVRKLLETARELA